MLPKLRLTHRLLLLWFVSAAAVLLVSGLAFRLLEAHEAAIERRARIQAAFGILHNQVGERANRLATSARALAERRSVVATLGLFAHYFDAEGSDAATFDPPARDLAVELGELARAAGADWAAVVGPAGTVAGYWGEGGTEYRVFFSRRADGTRTLVSEQGHPLFRQAAAVPRFLEHAGATAAEAGRVALVRCVTGDGPALVADAPIALQRAGVAVERLGAVVIGTCFDEDFVERIASQTGAAFGILADDRRLFSASMPDIIPPAAAAPPAAPEPSGVALAAVRWEHDDSYVLGAGDWVLGDGSRSTAVFVLDRASSAAPRNVLITAGLSGLVLTALLIVVGGLVYLRRNVTRPLERLMAAAVSARLGRYEAVDGASPGDEIGDLTLTFNHMTERIRSREEELRRLSRAVEQSPASVVITDPSGRIEYVNPRFSEVTGYRPDEVVGRTPSLLKSGQVADTVYAELWRTIQAGRIWRGELFNRVKDGRVICEQVSISPIIGEGGRLTHFVAVQEDVSQRKAAEARIKHLAYHDALTDLPNRLLFRERLDQALQRYRVHGRSFAVLLLDLDHFKDINDSLGHSVGDELLCLVARRIGGLLQEGDTLSRLGGDEFAILRAAIGEPSDASALAATIIGSFRESFAVGPMRLHSNTSIGIALPADDLADVDELISRADIALYKAKDSGRGGFVCFDGTMTEQVQRDAELTNDLAHALELRQLRLAYQPQVDLASGRLVGVEALLRWSHPELGEIPPGRFVPLAESRGLMGEIGLWVMIESCRQWLAWREAGLVVDHVAVNVSAAQFKGGRGFEALVEAIEQAGVPPGAVEVEFTESAFIEVGADTLAWIRELSRRGVHFAIDDFGTGYSSLVMLRQFQAHKLKVDQGFVRDMLVDGNDAAIVRATISLAKSLGMIVVAEGIEEAAQAEYLREMGCDIGQGYYFARPMSPEALAAQYAPAVAGR